MVNEEDEAYDESMYHTLSERLFTFSLTLIELNIKAIYFICLHLVKIILCQ